MKARDDRIRRINIRINWLGLPDPQFVMHPPDALNTGRGTLGEGLPALA
jgi:hypothetical protein